MKILCLIALICVSISRAEAHWEIDQTGKKKPHWHHHQAKGKSSTSKTTAKANKPDPWDFLRLALQPAHATSSNVRITVDGHFRVVQSDGIPDHRTGAFPNEGNPNTISEQNYTFKMPKEPIYAGFTTPLHMMPFGVAINGVPFDPGAAEWWNRDPYSGWQYEAMYLGPRLGLDENNAHVQPTGAYHYHGPPTSLLRRLSYMGKPVLIGFAADGFPMYGPYGYSDPANSKSTLRKLHSSYRLKQGTRSMKNNGPGGRYDGRFVQDYEFVMAAGDLDDCNGRFGVTPEYPKGTYYYVVTDEYPYIPRGFKGYPDESFFRRGRTTPNGFNNGPKLQSRPQMGGPGYPLQGPMGGSGGPPPFGQGGMGRTGGPPPPYGQGPMGGSGGPPPFGQRGMNGSGGPPPFGPPGMGGPGMGGPPPCGPPGMGGPGMGGMGGPGGPPPSGGEFGF